MKFVVIGNDNNNNIMIKPVKLVCDEQVLQYVNMHFKKKK